jgi:hypothetical protein
MKSALNSAFFDTDLFFKEYFLRVLFVLFRKLRGKLGSYEAKY